MKLCLCAGAGALVGGAAVKVTTHPQPRQRTHHTVVRNGARHAPPRLVRAVTVAQPIGVAAMDGRYDATGFAPAEPALCAPLMVDSGLPEIGNLTYATPLPPTYILGYLPIDGGGGGHRLRMSQPDSPVTPVPEPGAIGLFGIGAAGLLALRRRSAKPARSSAA